MQLISYLFIHSTSKSVYVLRTIMVRSQSNLDFSSTVKVSLLTTGSPSSQYILLIHSPRLVTWFRGQVFIFSHHTLYQGCSICFSYFCIYGTILCNSSQRTRSHLKFFPFLQFLQLQLTSLINHWLLFPVSLSSFRHSSNLSWIIAAISCLVSQFQPWQIP